MGEGQSAILQLKQHKQFTPNHPQHPSIKNPLYYHAVNQVKLTIRTYITT